MKYKALIGLEMHCEISETNTKVFSSAANNYSDEPNTSVRPIDMAFPGTLPVVNKEAVRKALMASIILGCKQPEYMYFERKNYYYPDLPKGFQLTQDTPPSPVGLGGEVEFECNGKMKKVRIFNLHLEEDAAKSEHEGRVTKIDYNRAGVPLLELVIYPDLHSADEAIAFLEHMLQIYRYAGISEADTRRGQVRCDVNVSIMDADKDENDPSNWGTKVEMKNINAVIKASQQNMKILALIDEPARTTNPTEGTALVSSLVKLLQDRAMSLVIVTHYNIKTYKNKCLRVKGLIDGKMNYELVETHEGEVPHEALNIAETLGIDSQWIEMAKEIISVRS